MYMYNVLFNFDLRTGLFSGDDNTAGGAPAVLRKSHNWLERRPGPPMVDPEDGSWDDLGEASTLLLHSVPPPDEILIRVAPDKRGLLPNAAATVQFVASFGRPAPFQQPQASPFTDDGTAGGAVLTTFVWGPVPRNTPSAADLNTGWVFTLGEVAKRPAGPFRARLSHRYQFSVGIIVTNVVGGVATVRHYGEDPDMDVGE